MKFEPCDKRAKLTAFAKDGTKSRVDRCAERLAEHFGQNVTPEICANCPVRVAITVAAAKRKAYQPPQIIDAATEKRPDLEKDGWLPCKDRQVGTLGSCCGGTTRQVKMCVGTSHLNGGEIQPGHCEACIYRRP